MMDISLDDQQVDEDVDAVKDQRAMSKSSKQSWFFFNRIFESRF